MLCIQKMVLSVFIAEKIIMQDKGEYDSPEALAEALGVHTSYVRRFLRLALLAPPIVDAIFAGKAPWTLSLTKLDTTLPYSWKEQMELFGMA